MLNNAVLSGTDFSRSKMAGSKLDEAELSRTRFSEADLHGCQLHQGGRLALRLQQGQSGEDGLHGRRHESIDVRRRENERQPSFGKAELNRSDFTGADLTGADMSKAELARALFKDAKLSGVDFSLPISRGPTSRG